MFNTLTKRSTIKTEGNTIVNLFMSYDSKYALSLCQVPGSGGDKMQLRAYRVNTQAQEPEIKIDYEGSYLKMLQVE